ncbi:hypothetical protein GCK72_001936 [Caenorhabditis remanei]|uniref:Uncharacterized protein n=1 Tax=Caenorhabditis remanei TaxID=31234 RepID=A0A6A5HQD8_CAERE|nr:hypothetical protein GCK72_001936 [Caenorhabditis remanei]KAF1770118.1 hypothetical protein GCK72_001936 [Caenorhabditis remanei]
MLGENYFKNKKKNSNKPPKPISSIPSSAPLESSYLSGPSTSTATPPFDQLDQEASTPPPKISRSYAIPKATKPEFKGILQKRLQQSILLYGGDGDAEINTPESLDDILEKLSYPTPEETFEDFFEYKRDLRTSLERNLEKHNEGWLQHAAHCYCFFETGYDELRNGQQNLYRSYGHCPQKEFLMETNEDLQRIYKDIIDRNITEELKEINDYVYSMKNRDQIEEACSTRKGLLDFFSNNPVDYLMREKFKTCLLFCDLIVLTVRSHNLIINDIEESFSIDGLPRNKKYCKFKDGFVSVLETMRAYRDKFMIDISRSQRFVLMNLIQMMPKFLGTAVDEYFEFDENAKKWQELKMIREEEARTKERIPFNLDTYINGDYLYRKFLRRKLSKENFDMFKAVCTMDNDGILQFDRKKMLVENNSGKPTIIFPPNLTRKLEQQFEEFSIE